jgi:hypothetical protein
MRAIYVFLVAFLNVSAKALGVFFTALFSVLSVLAWVYANSRTDDVGEEYCWRGDDDDGFDQFGRMLTPSEQGSSLVKRHR